ncbi:phosphotransferase family protein [Aspergillus stella-maris]|uniref:phosphotransferase family protein n=1 Tax=Aspergillus stella-maris TaxID=1810926 RepID=UPI003CCD0ADC
MSQKQEPDRQSLSSTSSDNDDNAEMFSAVLAALDKEQLPVLAADVLRRLHPDASIKTPTVGEPIYGSYHVLFRLTFDGGPSWIAKIPINGTAEKWNELSASSIASEANTMRLLRRETSIPLPEVVDFSSTTDNPLHCPYIIMCFVTGAPLYNVWFGHRLNKDVSHETTHSRRVRALEGISKAMLQLDKFTSSSPATLRDGTLDGRLRRVDHQAMLQKMFSGAEDADNDPIYVECPTSNDPKVYYTLFLDEHPPTHKVQQGVGLILRQLIAWIPEPSGADPFVLAHPDFDVQNFLVSEDGELLSIIDWDGVSTVPRSIGNRRYPGWLTRDWDPAMYGYEPSMDDGVEPEGVWEDSPETLAQYRGIYIALMAEHSGSSSGVNLTQMSLLTENLGIAVEDPRCRSKVVSKFVHEIYAAAGERPLEPIDYSDILHSFADGNVEDEVMEILRKGFDALLAKEGL